MPGCMIAAARNTPPAATKKRWKPRRNLPAPRGSFPRSNPRTRSTRRFAARPRNAASCTSSIFRAAATKIPTSIAKTFRNSMQQTRIQKLFDGARKEGRAALIAYITAGDPSIERTPEIAASLVRGGVDLIELGVPFSDPIADGPVIQRAAARALKAGTTVPKVLDVAHQIRKTSQTPILLFTYLNPVLRYGLEKLACDAKAAGI